MPNIKKIKNSGMIVGPQKANQPGTYFRKLLNVWQDSSGDFRPLGKESPTVNFNPAGLKYIAFAERFEFPFTLGFLDITALDLNQLKSAYEGIFYGYVYEDSNDDLWFRHHYVDERQVPREYQVNFAQASDNEGWFLGNSADGESLEATIWKGLYSNTQVNRKLFFRAGLNLFQDQTGAVVNLRKFDGLQSMTAGLPGPVIGCPTNDAAGDRYITVVPVRLGFDGELVAGEFLKFRANQTSSTIGFQTGSAPTPVTRSSAGYLEGSPGIYDKNNYDLRFCIRNTSGTTSEISPGIWQIASLDYECYPGDYLFVLASAPSNNSALFAVQVIETGVGFIRVKTDVVRAFREIRQDWEIEAGNFTASSFDFMTSIYNLIYSSTTNSGGVFKRALPFLPLAVGTISQVVNVDAAAIPISFLGLTSQIIGDWYDLTSAKIQFPDAIYAWSNYQLLLIGCDRNFLYFSDPTLGGCTEMTSGLANVAIPGYGYGPITGVMGSEDFIVISRERRNYVLVGDLATGNIRIRECLPDFIGAFSPRSMVAANGGVFLTTRKGVYFCTSSGNMTKISAPITGLFQEALQPTLEDGNSLPSIKMNTNFLELSIPGAINFDGNRVIMKVDEVRNSIVIFFKKSTTLDQDDQGACLVYNLDNNSWQEWGKFNAGITDTVFLPNYSTTTGEFNGSLVLARLNFGSREMINFSTGVFNDKAIVCTNWETVDQPSLEKKFLQVKFYGDMPDTTIKHFEDWQDWGADYLLGDDPKTDVLYPANSSFFHKKRIDSNNSLCVSVSLEFAERFRLRGMEIEINPIQEGMKK